MTAWPARLLVNTVYAWLAERARADDHAEAAMWGHASEESRDKLGMNRVALDEWLDAPMGRDAEAQQALLTYLKGA